MSKTFTVYIEKDNESGMYCGKVPSIKGAHTFAPTLDELSVKLKEVLELCLSELSQDEIRSIPEFAGISQIEATV